MGIDTKGFFRLAAALLALSAGPTALAAPAAAVLRLKSRVSMQELARQVSDPGSPRFRHFFTPEEIRALAAPDNDSYQAQLQALRADGFQVAFQSPTRLWLIVTAEQAALERAFRVKPSALFADRGTSADRWPLVAGATGIEPSVARRSGAKMRRALLDGPPSSKGITPDIIKKVYGFNPIYDAGVSGSGQHIAIATYGGFYLSDVVGYYQNLALSPMPTVDQIKFNGDPAISNDSLMETTMDAEFAGMIAPGASIHVYTSAQNNSAGEAQMFTAILDDNRSKVVNYSWSSCELQETLAHRQEMAIIFQRAVAQGVNIVVASGDAGAASCHADSSLQPGWPSTDPNVVSVGGTTLTVDGDAPTETAWGPCSRLNGCSGGGISGSVSLPDYQKALSAPFTRRSYPDVAFNADLFASPEPMWATYAESPDWYSIGGTSIGAPHWCGFLALVGNARQAAGKAPLGFLNPIIYALSSEQRAAFFTDITTVSNGTYSAGPGWDAVTGWGTPKASALLGFLKTL